MVNRSNITLHIVVLSNCHNFEKLSCCFYFTRLCLSLHCETKGFLTYHCTYVAWLKRTLETKECFDVWGVLEVCPGDVEGTGGNQIEILVKELFPR